MNIVILDDYQDAVRKLECASKLEAYPAKVYTNTVKGLAQLALRLKDADIIVLIRERTVLNRALIEKLPRLAQNYAGSVVSASQRPEETITMKVQGKTHSTSGPSILTGAFIAAFSARSWRSVARCCDCARSTVPRPIPCSSL